MAHSVLYSIAHLIENFKNQPPMLAPEEKMEGGMFCLHCLTADRSSFFKNKHLKIVTRFMGLEAKNLKLSACFFGMKRTVHGIKRIPNICGIYSI